MTRPAAIDSFQAFWPFYLSEHQHPLNRRLHFIGSTLALMVLLAALFFGHWQWAVLSLFCGYGFAWVGHFFVEKNKPASFRHPLWSFVADWKMWALTLSGRLPSEISLQVRQSK